MYNGHDRMYPRKLNGKNFEDWPSAKIGPLENFPLYGSSKVCIFMHVASQDIRCTDIVRVYYCNSGWGSSYRSHVFVTQFNVYLLKNVKFVVSVWL
jgi:hypothetical protein